MGLIETSSQRVSAHLSQARVLLVDPSAQSRSFVISVLKDLGVDTRNIDMATTYAEGKAILEGKHPQIVLSELVLSDGSGLDLIFKYRQAYPEQTSTVLLLTSGSATGNVVVEAAEEEVQAFILKPYTTDKLQNYILGAVRARITPSPYMNTIREGKEALNSKLLDQAVRCFEEASRMDEKPSLAYYYLGQTHYTMKELELAEYDYEMGLAYNDKHYKCLTGLYEVYSAQSRPDLSYEIAKRLATQFPVSANRLDDFIQLAVRTGHFEDVDMYYGIFSGLYYRTQHLKKCVTAALLVGGKHCLKVGERDRAIELFHKAVTTSDNSPRALRMVITDLLEESAIDPAEKFLKRFSKEQEVLTDYMVSNFLIQSRVAKDSRVIADGVELVRRHVYDQDVYRILIQKLTENGKVHSAEALIYEARKHWPEQRHVFEAWLSAKAS